LQGCKAQNEIRFGRRQISNSELRVCEFHTGKNSVIQYNTYCVHHIKMIMPKQTIPVTLRGNYDASQNPLFTDRNMEIKMVTSKS
jgi:hypothetical protein